MPSTFHKDVFFVTLIPCSLIIAWCWLLHFPWDWVLHLIIAIEALIFISIFYLEHQASHVNGAAGWMSFFSFFLQLAIVVTLTLSRIIILFFQLIL